MKAVLSTLLLALALAPAAPAYHSSGLVPVSSAIEVELRYLGDANFTGRRLPGYCENTALLLPRPASALARVQRRLARDGYGLRIYDAYRPARATRAMVRWAQRTGREHLLNGYIARRSRHNLGAAVDITLVRNGRALSMGSAYDSFSTRSHTRNVSGAALSRRLRLVDAMAAEGWANYRREWWHFDFPAPGARRLDVTIGC